MVGNEIKIGSRLIHAAGRGSVYPFHFTTVKEFVLPNPKEECKKWADDSAAMMMDVASGGKGYYRSLYEIKNGTMKCLTDGNEKLGNFKLEYHGDLDQQSGPFEYRCMNVLVTNEH